MNDPSGLPIPTLNPKVFIEFSVKEGEVRVLGRVIIELFKDIVPRTVKNFTQLIKKPKGSGYMGCNVHRIIPQFMIQTGDFTRGDGTGGNSIYGKYFEDENFDLLHDDAGLISMANSGPNTNGSQFFITLEYTPWLNGKHVVFGKVVRGMECVREMEKFGSIEGKPKHQIKITKCGKL